MPRAYENDLRRKFLAAYAGGKGTQHELAQLFGVSVGWVEKVCRQHRQSGQVDRIEQRHGLLNDASDAIAPQVVAGLLQKAAMTAMPLVMAQQGMNYTGEYIGGVLPDRKRTL